MVMTYRSWVRGQAKTDGSGKQVVTWRKLAGLKTVKRSQRCGLAPRLMSLRDRRQLDNEISKLIQWLYMTRAKG